MYFSQDNPQNTILQIQNQQQVKAKRSLYEIGEFEDQIYLQTYQVNEQEEKNRDNLEKWALTQNNQKYQKFSNTFYNQNLEVEKGKKEKTQGKGSKKASNKDKQKDKKEKKLDKLKKQNILDIFPKLPKNKALRYQPLTFKKRLSCRPIQQTMVSMNQLFDLNQNLPSHKPHPHSKSKRSQTPSIQSTFPIKPIIPTSHRESQTYSTMRESYKNQRSMSGALNIIKKQTQSVERDKEKQKENKKGGLMCRVVEKQTQKIRSQWMQFQRYTGLKGKDILDCIDFCSNY